jgi:hypothetical protein
VLDDAFSLMIYLRNDEIFRRNYDYHHNYDRLLTSGVVAFRWNPGIIIFQDKTKTNAPHPAGIFYS